MEPAVRSVDALELVLTASCNLRCRYCYQNDRKPRSMSWNVLRGALDLLLRSRRRDLEIVFLGGEPLLEFPLVERTVAYVRGARPAGKRIRYVLVTNGLLLDRAQAAFLDRHRVWVQLSFDGVAEAQDIRAPRTFAALDRLLDRLRLEQPRLFGQRLRVNMTLTSAAIPHLARSISYFVRKGVGEIAVSPVVTHDEGWRDEMLDDLDDQLARASRASLRHFRRTGRIPLLLFGRSRLPPRDRDLPPPDAMCRAPLGRTLAVDVDGRLHACAAFVESYQTFPSRFLRRRVEALRLGSLGDPGLAARLVRYPQTTRDLGIFHDKAGKHSALRRCAQCPFVRACSICPASIGHIPGNEDPNRVPEFGCAFNRAALAHRLRFLAGVRVSSPEAGRSRRPRVTAGAGRSPA